MADQKQITKGQLKKLQTEAFAVVKAWLHYYEDLNDYQVKLEGTTPPGNPPNPPGIPPR